jgi:hypothetical protein
LFEKRDCFSKEDKFEGFYKLFLTVRSSSYETNEQLLLRIDEAPNFWTKPILLVFDFSIWHPSVGKISSLSIVYKYPGASFYPRNAFLYSIICLNHFIPVIIDED